jgi:general secretion pathway protein M
MRLPVWASRMAALAILLMAGATFWLTLVQPLIGSCFEHLESISRSQAVLAKYQGLASMRGQIDAGLQKLQAEQDNEGRLLTGGSVQLVGAKLQNRMKELIETENGNLTSMQVLPAQEEKGFQRISMAVNLTAPMASLQKIFYAVENQSPYLFIENFQLMGDQRYGETAEQEQQGELQVHFEVFGFMALNSHDQLAKK